MPKKGRQADRMTPGFTGPYKGQPQQGTLFDKRALDQLPANQAQTEQRIGPRGYSPARLREIKANFNPQIQMHKRELGEEEGWGGTHNVYTFQHRDQNREEGGPEYVKTQHVPVAESDKYIYGVTPVKYHDEIKESGSVSRNAEGPYDAINRSMGRAKSKMMETLARSTAPASDLEGLTHIDIKPEDKYAGTYMSKIGRGQKASQTTPYGEQRLPGAIPREQKAGHINLSPTEDEWHEPGQSEMTLLHELGHHASWMAGRPHAAYDNPAYRAAEESGADRYSMQHYRQRADRTGRAKVKNTWPEGVQRSIDPRTHSYGARGNYSPDEMPKEGKWSIHQPEYKLKPHMVLPEHLKGGGYNDRHYPSHQEERERRPMLDEGAAEVFTPKHVGIARPLTPERALSGEPPNRDDIYKSNAYHTGAALDREHTEAAKQWEVRRNVHPASISRQFG